MDLKLDKETIIKHRFWFSLPVIALCVLIAWGCEVGVRSQADRRFTTALGINQNLKNLQNDPERRNNNWINAVSEKKVESDKERGRLWVLGFDAQNDVLPMNRVAATPDSGPASPGENASPTFKPLEAIRDPIITWPREIVTRWNQTNVDRLRQEEMQGYSLWQNPDPRTNPNAAKVLDFGEELYIIPLEYQEHYTNQFNEVVDLIKWYDPQSGRGAVRTPSANGDHRGYAYVLLNRQGLSTEKVSKEEAWTLQQDLAIRRELFKSLAEVMQAHSRCAPEWEEIVPPKSEMDKRFAAENRSQIFYNFTWATMPPPAAAGAERAKPTVLLPEQGWEIQFDMSVQGQKAVFTAVGRNYSPTVDVPDMPLEVYFFRKGGTDQEAAQPVVLRLGSIPRAQGGKPGEARLKEALPLPADAIQRVSRLRRTYTEPKLLDYDFCGNVEWQVQLRLLEATGNETLIRGELTNRSARRLLVPGFELELVQRDNNEPFKEEMRLTIDAINAGESRTFEYTVRKRAKAIRQVSQALDWRTTPVKRLDQIAVGALAHRHSDRTRIQPMVTYDFKKKNLKPEPAGAAPASSAGDLGGGVGMGPGDGPGTGGSGGLGGGRGSGLGGGANDKASDVHKIPLSNYLEVTTELRRLPVAMALVVREDNINQVLNALANSRLRFHITQVTWNRIPGLPRPAPVGGVGGGGGAGVGAGGNVPPSGGGGGGGLPNKGGGGGMPPAGGGQQPPSGGGGGGGLPNKGGGGGVGMGAGGPAGGGGDTGGQARSGQVWAEDTGNVVELQIYGLVTLYECPDAVKRIAERRAKVPAAPGGTAGQ